LPLIRAALSSACSFPGALPRRGIWSRNRNRRRAHDNGRCPIQKVLELAQTGDVSCLRMLLDRLWSPRKGQPLNIKMPPIKTSQDVLAAIASVWTAIAEGQLTPDEAGTLSLVVERSIQVIQLQEVVQRIEDLERKVRPTQ
jgi:hypothetical protein